MLQFNKEELRVLKKLNTPKKIQDFLDTIPANFDKTFMSPRMVLRERKAHCFEGALLAAAALWINGGIPLILDLKAIDHDLDHVVTPFRLHGRWGAISKVNHAVLRYREPVYKTTRELAMSYFHEYFLDNGKKTLRSYSRLLDLREFNENWTITDKSLRYIADKLDGIKHFSILTRGMIAGLRSADPIEIEAGKIVQWRVKSGKK